MINNRQGGRRRGRGGQGGSRNLGGQPGNRQDNRQRGNAAQLLEKYKSMARDSQLAGDRVQTEYYLQYADHYFRMLGETRARFEDQRPRRDQDMDGDEGDDEFVDAGEEQASDERPRRAERFERGDRPDRSDRPERGDRPNQRDRDRPRFDREERTARDNRDESESSARVNGADDSLPLDVLPPAIGADTSPAMAADEEAPAPRPRRARRPRPTEGDEEIAPAA